MLNKNQSETDEEEVYSKYKTYLVTWFDLTKYLKLFCRF